MLGDRSRGIPSLTRGWHTPDPQPTFDDADTDCDGLQEIDGLQEYMECVAPIDDASYTFQDHLNRDDPYVGRRHPWTAVPMPPTPPISHPVAPRRSEFVGTSDYRGPIAERVSSTMPWSVPCSRGADIRLPYGGFLADPDVADVGCQDEVSTPRGMSSQPEVEDLARLTHPTASIPSSGPRLVLAGGGVCSACGACGACAACPGAAGSSRTVRSKQGGLHGSQDELEDAWHAGWLQACSSSSSKWFANSKGTRQRSQPRDGYGKRPTPHDKDHVVPPPPPPPHPQQVASPPLLPPPPPPPPFRGYQRARRLPQEPMTNPASVVVSIGSVGHPSQCAEACKFIRKSRGCKDGAKCDRCHLCRWRKPMVAAPAPMRPTGT